MVNLFKQVQIFVKGKKLKDILELKPGYLEIFIDGKVWKLDQNNLKLHKE